MESPRSTSARRIGSSSNRVDRRIPTGKPGPDARGQHELECRPVRSSGGSDGVDLRVGHAVRGSADLSDERVLRLRDPLRSVRVRTDSQRGRSDLRREDAGVEDALSDRVRQVLERAGLPGHAWTLHPQRARDESGLEGGGASRQVHIRVTAREWVAQRAQSLENADVTMSVDERSLDGVCWCCGQPYEKARMAHLGEHPEVTVCARCARSLLRWARVADARGSRSWSARFGRASLRVRKFIVQRDWHRRARLGRALAWLGRRLP